MAYNNLISRTEVQSLINEQVSTLMLQGLNNQSAAMNLFNRIVIPTNRTRFPVISALPTAFFVTGDTGMKQTTEVNWTDKYIDVEELAAIVPIPQAVLDDATYDIWGNVRPLLENAIARALDAAIFFGTNKPASWPSDINTAANAAGNIVNRSAGTPPTAASGGIAELINQLLATMEADGYDATGFVLNPTYKTRLRAARDVNGQLLMDINGGVSNVWGLPTQYPMAGLWPAPATGAAEAFALRTENFILGVRQDFTTTIHTEGVITDNGTPPIIQYNLMQQDMAALRVVFRVGWQVSNPMNYQQGTEASRYPAAVLRQAA
jgi:HK97 family phage major capsid protein